MQRFYEECIAIFCMSAIGHTTIQESLISAEIYFFLILKQLIRDV